jgi:hypothetical protein
MERTAHDFAGHRPVQVRCLIDESAQRRNLQTRVFAGFVIAAGLYVGVRGALG